ncbi:MAG: thiopeptide-type bacteriocin biosynthesis protein [Sphingobacterium sp.]|jgi:thiopeptide-type bacteriocin biosynthesis protein|nr:thiopeptide-type bacteriocin biosynthesis protein [Sphingobacterium sp.]
MTKRIFLPGEEWLYVKIYCNETICNKIIKEDLSLIIDKLDQENTIKQFFFIKYADEGGFHLRLRFLLANFDLSAVILSINKFLAPYIQSNVVRKIQIENYLRELERYGQDNIEMIESLFNYHSRSILKLLKSYSFQDLWMINLIYIDSCLSEFSLSRKELLAFYSSGFEHLKIRMNLHNFKPLASYYRLNKEKVSAYFNSNKDFLNDENFSQFRYLLAKVFKKSIQREVYDIFHMNFNRIAEYGFNDIEVMSYFFLIQYSKELLLKPSV